MEDWQKQMTATIGKNVKHLREKKGLTARALSEKTEGLGFKINRSGISQLELQTRQSISVAEWLILARALEVAPVVLLMPDYPDGETQYLPGHHAMGYEVAEWITGQRSTNLAPSENNSAPLETPTQLAALLAEREDLEQTEWEDIKETFKQAMNAKDHEQKAQILNKRRDISERAVQRIAANDNNINRLGYYANQNHRSEIGMARYAEEI